MRTDELTPEEVRAIAAEIDAWHARFKHEKWHIASIAHLYHMPMECYQVVYGNGLSTVFTRDERGVLMPEGKFTYYAPEFDRKKMIDAPTSE